MHSREFLELVAAAVNVDDATYPNDSKLEQKVTHELKVMTAKAGTGTTKLPAAKSVAAVSGGANV